MKVFEILINTVHHISLPYREKEQHRHNYRAIKIRLDNKKKKKRKQKKETPNQMHESTRNWNAT